MNVLGEIWDNEGQEAACAQAEQVGWVLATELSACGIDLSFTPVLDLDWGQCAVIGNRSFHRDANIVTQLALALQKGLNKGGMKSCGKHFPGHGFVEGDSHHVLPCDERSREALEAADLIPFRALSQAGHGRSHACPCRIPANRQPTCRLLRKMAETNPAPRNRI